MLFIVELFQLAPDYTLVEFVQEPGYLQLTEKSRQKLNITVQTIHLGELLLMKHATSNVVAITCGLCFKLPYT